MRSLGLPNKTSSYEVSALKIKNTVQHDVNSVLEGFMNYYLTLAENLVKMHLKSPNTYLTLLLNIMILGDYFHLESDSKNLILTILKASQFSKTANIDNLSGSFLKNEAKFLPKPNSDACSLSITSEKFPDSCKVAELKPLYKKGFLTLACNYRPIPISL